MEDWEAKRFYARLVEMIDIANQNKNIILTSNINPFVDPRITQKINDIKDLDIDLTNILKSNEHFCICSLKKLNDKSICLQERKKRLHGAL